MAERIVVEPGKHSLRGASSAQRWLNCSGSILLTERLAEQGLISKGTNRPAAEGTAAHLVLSTCLEDGTDAADMAGMEIEVEELVFIIDQEMVDGVQECLDWTRNTMAECELAGEEPKLYVEKGMTSIFDGEVYGTADIIIVTNKRIIVVDFKYGRGVTVEPDSDQNAYYIYLALENYADDQVHDMPVESWIAQPRIPHPDGTIRCYKTTAGAIVNWWMDTVLPGIEATRDPTSLLTMGSHCKWCPNKVHCPALQDETFSFQLDQPVATLTDDELGALLDKLEAIKAFQPTLEFEALRRARQGDKIPGRKLVRKKANRIFRDQLLVASEDNPDEMVVLQFDEEVKKTFGDAAYAEPKVKSPAQLEKVTPGGKTFVQDWAHKPDAGLTLAAEGDKRVEVRPNVERVRSMRKPDVSSN